MEEERKEYLDVQHGGGVVGQIGLRGFGEPAFSPWAWGFLGRAAWSAKINGTTSARDESRGIWTSLELEHLVRRGLMNLHYTCRLRSYMW